MSAGDVEYTPATTGEVQQEEPAALPLRPVPVDVAGPVRVQLVPARSASARQVGIMSAGDPPIRAGNADARRRVLTLISVGGSFLVGYGTSGQSACTQGVAALWPAGVPLPITHQEEVYVSIPTGGGASITISAVEELWAD